MSVTALAPADPGPRHTADLPTLDPEFTSPVIYGFDGRRYHVHPVKATTSGLFTAIEVAK